MPGKVAVKPVVKGSFGIVGQDQSGFGDERMIRKATVEDAEQLSILNAEFNGDGETTIEKIRDSLVHNCREVVIVDDEKGELKGFVCVQLKKSFCYDDFMPEITEVYVRPEYIRQKIASRMIRFAEEYCEKNYPLHKFELLTGEKNRIAQLAYDTLGYSNDHELHLSKRVKE